MKFCLWISGLPGSGKSTIARELENSLSKICVDAITLNLDEIRKIITPNPSYTNEERDIVYGALAYMAKLLVVTGCTNVVIDATGHRKAYRDRARTLIPEFAEVYIKCPLEICQEREASRDAGNIETDLYRKARSGHLKGGFPGVTAVYEEPENPEVVVNSDILDPSESAELIMNYARSRWLRTHFLHTDQ
jgi:adenylylsulfate kinase